jgi:polyhydroxyalkanoate synthesis regulator phasin
MLCVRPLNSRANSHAKPRLANALRAHVEALKGHVARLEDELTRADRATAELTALAQRLADLAARP